MKKSSMLIPSNKMSAMTRWEHQRRLKLYEAKIKGARSVVNSGKHKRPKSAAYPGLNEAEDAPAENSDAVTSGESQARAATADQHKRAGAGDGGSRQRQRRILRVGDVSAVVADEVGRLERMVSNARKAGRNALDTEGLRKIKTKVLEAKEDEQGVNILSASVTSLHDAVEAALAHMSPGGKIPPAPHVDEEAVCNSPLLKKASASPLSGESDGDSDVYSEDGFDESESENKTAVVSTQSALAHSRLESTGASSGLHIDSLPAHDESDDVLFGSPVCAQAQPITQASSDPSPAMLLVQLQAAQERVKQLELAMAGNNDSSAQKQTDTSHFAEADKHQPAPVLSKPSMTKPSIFGLRGNQVPAGTRTVRQGVTGSQMTRLDEQRLQDVRFNPSEVAATPAGEKSSSLAAVEESPSLSNSTPQKEDLGNTITSAVKNDEGSAMTGQPSHQNPSTLGQVGYSFKLPSRPRMLPTEVGGVGPGSYPSSQGTGATSSAMPAAQGTGIYSASAVQNARKDAQNSSSTNDHSSQASGPALWLGTQTASGPSQEAPSNSSKPSSSSMVQKSLQFSDSEPEDEEDDDVNKAPESRGVTKDSSAPSSSEQLGSQKSALSAGLATTVVAAGDDLTASIESVTL